MKKYYVVMFQYENNSYYCVWYTADEDSFVMHKGKLVFFTSQEEIQHFCQNTGIVCEREITIYNVAEMKCWLESKDLEVNCQEILSFWNIFDDFYRAIGTEFIGNDEKSTHIYEKLFYGNHLPSTHGLKEKYVPEWNEWEHEMIVNTMKQGVNMLDNVFLNKK